MRKSKALCFFILVLTIFSYCLGGSISAAALVDLPQNELHIEAFDKAAAVYLYSYNGNRIVYIQGEDKKLLPASTAKIMTGILACQKFENDLDTQVEITEEMLIGIEGNCMDLRVGMQLSIRELIYGTVCGANNDAAQALAVAHSGSISAFVKEMNTYADRLFMKDTEYKNPTGLDAEGAYTTIKDVSILSKEAEKSSLYMQASSAASYKLLLSDGKEYTIYNRNALESQFSAQGYLNKNANGIIAGSTDNAGFMCISVAEKDGIKFLCIVMGAESDTTKIHSYSITNLLLKKAFDSFSIKKIVSAGTEFEQISPSLSNTTALIPCVAQDDVIAFLPNIVDPQNDLSYEPYLFYKQLKAPIKQNDIIGGVNIYYDDIFIAHIPLVAGAAAEANGILTALDGMRSFFISPKFLIFTLIALPLLIIYLRLEYINDKKRHTAKVKYNNFY